MMLLYSLLKQKGLGYQNKFFRLKKIWKPENTESLQIFHNHKEMNITFVLNLMKD